MVESSLISNMPDMFLEIDNKGQIVRYLGGGLGDPLLDPAELAGAKVADIWSVSAAKLMLRNIRRALTDRRELRFEFELSSGDVTASYEARLLVRGFNRVLVILRHQSAAQLQERESNEQQMVDTLTGLPRSAVFREQVDLMLADARLRERGLAVVALDIDGFRDLNNSLGRDVGDAVLRESATRIEKYLRGSDSFARLGSDEFVLVVADVDTREHADTIADRVNESFSTPIDIMGHQIEVTPSCGIALFPSDGPDADSLLRNARVALNEARMQGRNVREFYSNTMRERTNQRLDEREELRWALERGQFSVHYQPRVSLESGLVVGLEALLRWDHPIRGTLTANHFMELAESGGMMREIGQWAIEQVLADLADWTKTDVQLPVSVNLTEAEFANPSLVDQTRQALKDTGVSPEYLQFEVTERMLMSHDRAYIITHKLTKLGVGLLVDQFGQGYSSASKLIRFPVQAVKIGAEILRDMHANPQQSAVCAALIAMAREMGWRVIGVGVETREELEFLRKRGCNAAQGHFLSAPVVVDEVLAYRRALEESPFDGTLIRLDETSRGPS